MKYWIMVHQEAKVIHKTATWYDRYIINEYIKCKIWYSKYEWKCRWSVNVTATQVVLQNKMWQMQIIHLLLDILGLLLI